MFDATAVAGASRSGAGSAGATIEVTAGAAVWRSGDGAAVLGGVAAVADSGDWPQFRGGAALGKAAATVPLDWAADRAWDADVGVEAEALSLPADLPKALALRLLERGFAHFALPLPRGSDLARMQERLAAGQAATLGGIQARAGEGRWLLCREAARNRFP